jgi:hypothetical protein
MKDLAHPGLMLSRFALMVQTAVLNGQFLDLFSPFDDGGVTCQRRIKNTALAGVTMHHRGGVYGGAKLVQVG